MPYNSRNLRQEPATSSGILKGQMQRKLRLILGPIIIVGTLAAFTWYLSENPEVVRQLKKTSPLTLVLLFVLYAGTTLALMGVLHGSLKLYKKHMSTQENFLLTTYSSLVNFFGPGQSGPGFRAAYLKLKHEVKIKQYIFATLLYYAFYALFSGLLLVGTSRPWWQTVLAVGVISAVCIMAIKYFMRRNSGITANISARTFRKSTIIIASFSLIQVFIIALIYYVELKSLDSSVTITQALAYTGAANFALFVSLTPGAIGIREAFLVFSQNLHGIPNDLIVAANVLDRAVYIAFLGVLFLIILLMHAGSKLQLDKVKESIRLPKTGSSD